MLLNEFLKEHGKNEAQQEQIEALTLLCERAGDTDPKGECAIVGHTSHAASCKPLFELLNKNRSIRSNRCSEAERFHASVIGAGCVIRVKGGKDGQDFLEDVSVELLCLAFAALLVTVFPSSALAQAPRLDTARVSAGFTAPVFVTAPPGDTTRLFVVQQSGQIKIINLPSCTVNATPFLDISSEVNFIAKKVCSAWPLIRTTRRTAAFTSTTALRVDRLTPV
jgi:hypothetical protein